MVDNKVKHLSLDIYRKNISLMKINNIILVLHTRKILLSSSVIYFFLYMGSVPTIHVNIKIKALNC